MSEQEEGDDQASPRIIWWDRLEPAVTPRYELEDFATDEDFDTLVTDGGNRNRGCLRYDSNGTVHVQVGGDEETTVFTETGERNKVLCGAGLTGSGMEIDGMRLHDEYQDGNVCETCLDRLMERDSTIPGFISNGEVVSHV